MITSDLTFSRPIDWSIDQLIIWLSYQLIIWYDKKIWSFDQLIIWYDERIWSVPVLLQLLLGIWSFDRLIIWSSDHLIIRSSDHLALTGSDLFQSHSDLCPASDQLLNCFTLTNCHRIIIQSWTMEAQVYLYKLSNVFLQTAKYICLNC